MDVFIYFCERLPCGLDEVEDCLSDALGKSGKVTGAGAGVSGSNIDIEITDEGLSEVQVSEMVRAAVAALHLPPSTSINIDGKAHRL